MATTVSAARVVVGVSGGVAAYKAASLVRLFTESGADVTVVPTPAALEFVGAPTWEALSGNRVTTTVWQDVPDVRHVQLGQQADLIIVVPATANLMARAAAGLADDLLTTTLLAARCPVVMAPAMHTEMWLHPATVANVATLRGRGVLVIEPDSGRLTGSDSGPGRLPAPERIYECALQVLEEAVRDEPVKDLAGVDIVISAGGTREPLDPVRFLGNRSSGRQGYALASVAAARGAAVTLVSANVTLPVPAGVTVVEVGTAAELHEAMRQAQSGADVLVMSAAVADFRPTQVSAVKIKSGLQRGSAAEVPLLLTRTEDVLADLVAHRQSGQVIVGFAAETGDAEGDVLTHARTKLAAKGCDLLVVNDVSGGAVFGQTDNQIVILSGHTEPLALERADKAVVAGAVLDAVAALLPPGSAVRR